MDAYLRQAPALEPGEARLLPYACAAVWPEVVNDFFPTSAEDLPESIRVVECMRHFLDHADLLAGCLVD